MTLSTSRLLALLLACMLFSGCTSMKKPQPGLFDLGLAPPAAALPAVPALPPLALADIDAPEWLDSPAIFYRLNYASQHQPRPYANSRWSMPPAQLFGQRLKSRIVQGGGTVLSASDGAVGVPVLRVEAEEFSQVFTSTGQSEGLVAMRLSVLEGRRLLGQKRFLHRVPAPSADVEGGVAALADASNAVITDMLQWLAGLGLAH
jgi:cholesterol transport system auxiliary component